MRTIDGAGESLSGKYTGSFGFGGSPMEETVELNFQGKDGDGGRTYIIEGNGRNGVGHYAVNGEFDPSSSTVSMQRMYISMPVDTNEEEDASMMGMY